MHFEFTSFCVFKKIPVTFKRNLQCLLSLINFRFRHCPTLICSQYYPHQAQPDRTTSAVFVSLSGFAKPWQSDIPRCLPLPMHVSDIICGRFHSRSRYQFSAWQSLLIDTNAAARLPAIIEYAWLGFVFFLVYRARGVGGDRLHHTSITVVFFLWVLAGRNIV